MRSHSRDAARSRFSPGSKAVVLPSASSTDTPPGDATMSSARPIAAMLTASGMGRSMSITSCPASRAAVTRSTRSGVRSGSRPRIFVAVIIRAAPPHSWGGVGEADGGADSSALLPLMGRCRRSRRRHSFSFLDVLPSRAQQRALEVVADQRPAGLEQVVEGLEQPPLGSLGLAPLRLDALSYVPIKEVDSLPRRAVGGGGVVLAQLHQGTERNARSDQLHARRDRLQVIGRVERLLTALDRHQEPGLLEAPEQRLGDAAPLGELAQGQGLRRGRTGDRRDQRLVRGFQLTGQEALDDGQGEALLLKLLDPLQPVDMRVAIPRDPAVSPRCLEEALALVEADS